MPANPTVAKKWLIYSGIVTSGSATMSFLNIIQRLKNLFPTQLNEDYIYMALAFSIIGALPLIFTKKVLTVSVAQVGVFLGLIYLLFAFEPVFKNLAKNILPLLTLLFILVFVILFSDGLQFAFKQKSWSDLLLSILMLIFFVLISIIPLNQIICF